MKKVLFLDIDSVLNDWGDLSESYAEMKKGGNGRCNGKYILGMGNTPVSIAKLNRLHRIISETNCDIVGISSWFTFRNDKDTVADLFKIDILEIGYCTSGTQGRYVGCRDWLIDHPDYTSAVVLDDIPMADGFVLNPIHVQPRKYGLTEELTEKCIEILNNEYESLCGSLKV